MGNCLNNSTIYFSVGDPSGDRNSALIIKELRNRYPSITVKGLGGPAMDREGFISLFDFPRFNVIGYIDVYKDLLFFIKEKNRFIELLKNDRPALLVCVDYSGFNTPLMKAAKSLDIPVLWFIAPMIWAWKRYKHGPRLAEYATHIATILPFEPKEWHEFTNAVSYVGNPLMEDIKEVNRRDKSVKTIALVPGSRKSEVRKMIPIMVEVADRLLDIIPDIKIIVSKTEYLDDTLYSSINIDKMELFSGSLEELFDISDIALVTSGTATLQAALAVIPHVVIYKTSPIAHRIFKLLLTRLHYIALPNIILDEEAVKEFVQKDVTTDNLFCEIEKLILDNNYYKSIYNKLLTLRGMFGAKQPSKEIPNLMETIVNGTK